MSIYDKTPMPDMHYDTLPDPYPYPVFLGMVGPRCVAIYRTLDSADELIGPHVMDPSERAMRYLIEVPAYASLTDTLNTDVRALSYPGKPYASFW